MDVFILQGLFYDKEGSIWVQEKDSDHKPIDKFLSRFSNLNVRIFLHHIPNPTPSNRWGVGSCFWQPADCPFGHHQNPQDLLHFDAVGVLDYVNRSLLTPNGVKQIPLGHLCGHRSRLILIGLPSTPLSDLSSVESKAKTLKDVLSKLKLSLETL